MHLKRPVLHEALDGINDSTSQFGHFVCFNPHGLQHQDLWVGTSDSFWHFQWDSIKLCDFVCLGILPFLCLRMLTAY